MVKWLHQPEAQLLRDILKFRLAAAMFDSGKVLVAKLPDVEDAQAKSLEVASEGERIRHALDVLEEFLDETTPESEFHVAVFQAQKNQETVESSPK